jgi:release factor glutamine methyltransferase
VTAAPDEAAIVLRLRAAGCVFAEDEARLLIEAMTSSEDLEDAVSRRVEGLPLEQILGWAEFCGLRILVAPDVFVPRQRTEFLVREAASLARSGTVALDLCCGSGALGVAFASLVNGVENGSGVDLYAADIEALSVACARRNVAPIGGRVFEGDLFDPLPSTLRGRVDILLCNVPYVPTDAIELMPPEARDYEPRVTLDGGSDGLDVLRRVAGQAPEWLASGGHLLVEMSEEQAPAVVAIFSAAGMLARVAESEEYSATVVVGTRP